MAETLSDDPLVKIPAAVRASTARSNAMIAELQKNGVITGTDPNAEVTTEGNENDPAALLEAPANAVDPAQPEVVVEDENSWEHKYKSAHGRLLAMQQENRKLADRVVNLEGVLSAMTAPPAASDAPPARLITDEEENDYGKDMLSVVGKKAREVIEPLLAAQQKEIDRLKGLTSSVVSASTQNAREAMHEKLDAELPQWLEINDNPEFLAWLALPDAFSGVIRHEMLKSAYAQNNGSRVLAFFKGFLSEEAATKPAQAREPDPSTTTRVAKIPLETLAAPGKAKTAAASTGAPAEKPYISRAQIAAFYADVAAGKYRGRDEQKIQHEAQIFSAQAEGRITP